MLTPKAQEFLDCVRATINEISDVTEGLPNGVVLAALAVLAGDMLRSSPECCRADLCRKFTGSLNKTLNRPSSEPSEPGHDEREFHTTH